MDTFLSWDSLALISFTLIFVVGHLTSRKLDGCRKKIHNRRIAAIAFVPLFLLAITSIPHVSSYSPISDLEEIKVSKQINADQVSPHLADQSRQIERLKKETAALRTELAELSNHYQTWFNFLATAALLIFVFYSFKPNEPAKPETYDLVGAGSNSKKESVFGDGKLI